MFPTAIRARRLSSHEIHQQARRARNRALQAHGRRLRRQLVDGVARLLRSGSRLALRCANEWYQRRAIRALRQLDDRMLADIGLSRTDIEFVVRCGPPTRANQARRQHSGRHAIAGRRQPA
jgi:uncharacterized protein YjiS (DUF1127 family)